MVKVVKIVSSEKSVLTAAYLLIAMVFKQNSKGLKKNY